MLIVETQLKHYRKRFLTDLAERLDQHGVALKVAYSDGAEADVPTRDTVDLDGRIGVKVPAIRLLGNRVLLQPVFGLVRESDLVIIEQGNKLVINYLLLAMSSLGLKRVAYWGHGYNHQAVRFGASEWLKRKLVARVDWWFSYTSGVTRYLVEQGVSPATISTLQNTLEASEISDAIAALTAADRTAVRNELGLGPDARLALYCGALTREKRLEFLIATLDRARAIGIPLELLVIGDGPERGTVARLAASRPYVHLVGPVFGSKRAPYFAISDVFVMPALVGLAGVDAFAAGLPVATTDLPTHGPEIEYLRRGINGIVSRHDVDSFAADLAMLLRNEPALRAMRTSARATADRLPLSHMVEQFVDGIMRCLESR